MDWLQSNSEMCNTFASLGSMQGSKYVANENCLNILEEIIYKLQIEDQGLRTYRRSIGYGQNIQYDLIPLLINTKCPKILDMTILLLVNLTIPIECLLNIDALSRSASGRHILFELNRLLRSCKSTFTDLRTVKSVVDYLKRMVQKKITISGKNCNSINNCLLLIRNILHIQDERHLSADNHNGNTSLQNQLIWNLFTQNLDKQLLYLMSCSQRSYWSVTMVQLIALMYKEQHVTMLQKQLNFWFEAVISDSSEDNESNTTPLNAGASGDSSSMLTSDPTSDSSDNGVGSGHRVSTGATCADVNRRSNDFKNKLFASPLGDTKPVVTTPMIPTVSQETGSNIKSEDANVPFNSIGGGGIKRSYPSSVSELSDCGYGTQIENQATLSTSSNDDDNPYSRPINHPPSNQKQKYNAARNVTIPDRKLTRRKKLVKKSRNNLMKMKRLVHYTPTDEDISNILKEFTVDFLLKSYGFLVKDLHDQLMTNLQVQIDTSHFFWLVTYFLKFASQLELEIKQISAVLSYDIVSYLTYEGVSLCEQMTLVTKNNQWDLKPCQRRMHLVVTAIREFLQVMETYKNFSHLSASDKVYLQLLQGQISATTDLKCLFILLIRQYNADVQSKQYLQDLIVTNHTLLTMLDADCNGGTGIFDHIKQFATVEIMRQYGFLLQDFRENGKFVNDCIFEIMHHVGGDIGCIEILFQPIILKTYSLIWETEYELSDDWTDLIEYVIHTFINTPQRNNLRDRLQMKNSKSFNFTESIESLERELCESKIWDQGEMDNLYWYYRQFKNSKYVVRNIIKQFKENGNLSINSHTDVIQQLLRQTIISLVDYDVLMKLGDGEIQRENPKLAEVFPKDDAKSSNEVSDLCNGLLAENKGHLLKWLQKILLECCYVKLQIEKANDTLPQQNQLQIMEPVPFHYISKNKKQSVPLVPWSTDQHNILNYEPFSLLLNKLGLHRSGDAAKSFVRIPEFWTVEMLYSVALKLGPIDKNVLKFDESVLAPQNQRSTVFCSSIENSADLESMQSKNINVVERSTPPSIILSPTPNLLDIVIRSNGTDDEDSAQNFRRDSPTSDTTNLPQLSTRTLAKLLPLQNSSCVKDTTEHKVQKQSSDGGNLDDDNQELASICETLSISSGFTRMYVSDEEENCETL